MAPGDIHQFISMLESHLCNRFLTTKWSHTSLILTLTSQMHKSQFIETDCWVRNEIFVLQNVVHELRITNQVIYLNPPIEECRYKLYQEMFAWKMVVLSLPRIQSQRYQVSLPGTLTVTPRTGPPQGSLAPPLRHASLNSAVVCLLGLHTWGPALQGKAEEACVTWQFSWTAFPNSCLCNSDLGSLIEVPSVNFSGNFNSGSSPPPHTVEVSRYTWN